MSKQENQTNPEAEKSESELFADTNVTMKTGRLVKDAETISNGKFIKMRIATNKQYLDTDGMIQSTTNYFNALVSSNLKEAFEVAKDLKQGDWVYIKGEDSSQSFDTPEGYKQTAVTTFAYRVALKQTKTDQSASETQAPQPA